MGNIYFTSDLHIGHNKNFIYGNRGFPDVFSHDKAIVDNWNSIVEDEDEVYVLGDIMLGDNKYGSSVFNQLKGLKHIITGNHDTNARIDLFPELRGVVDVSLAKMFKFENFNFFLCHYPVLCAFPDKKPLNKHLVCLCGHTHYKDKFYEDNPFIYNVALDAQAMSPVCITQIISDIKEKFASIASL